MAPPAHRKSSWSRRTDSAASDPPAAWLPPKDTPHTRLQARRTPPQDGTSRTGTRNSSRLRNCTWPRATKDEKVVKKGLSLLLRSKIMYNSIRVLFSSSFFRVHIIFGRRFFTSRGMGIGSFVPTAVSTIADKKKTQPGGGVAVSFRLCIRSLSRLRMWVLPLLVMRTRSTTCHVVVRYVETEARPARFAERSQIPYKT